MWRLMRDAQNDGAGAPLNTNTGIQKDGAGAPLIMARGAQKGDAGAPHRLSGAEEGGRAKEGSLQGRLNAKEGHL